MRRAGQNPTDVEVVATIKKNFLNILKGNKTFKPILKDKNFLTNLGSWYEA